MALLPPKEHEFPRLTDEDDASRWAAISLLGSPDSMHSVNSKLELTKSTMVLKIVAAGVSEFACAEFMLASAIGMIF